MIQHSYGEKSEFEEKMLQVNRVSKKIKGGNKVGYSVLMVVGDRKGQVGVALAKAPEVQTAVKKAVSRAKKDLITVPQKGSTIPGVVLVKFGGASVLLKPAPKGSGIIAGGSPRTILELGGISNASVKMLGNNNKINNAYATIKALKKLGLMLEKAKAV
jgi:small subunit ribosomal protein S5